MFDGSSLSYEENVTQTAEIVKISHAFGVAVAGDLGYVGKTSDVPSPENFTKPEQAVDFVRRTGVDALAIAIGNQHGVYKGVPKLDFERLKAIRAKVDCGLVLHGGSGISEEDFVKAIKCGINKVNIYTAMDEAVKKFNIAHFTEYGTYLDYTKALTVVVKDVVKQHMELFARGNMYV
jgi:fructose-bisphosphate aldolase class II